jgi:hypothetical protein
MRPRQQTFALALAALTVATLPAAASASAPWSAPAAVPGATGAPYASAFTLAGHGVLLAPSFGGGTSPTQLDAVTPEGAVTSTIALSFAEDLLATYGGDRIAVAGRTLATSGPNANTIDDSSLIVTRFGTPTALGAQRTVPGSKGQQDYALASNHAGLMALVTGSLSTRTVFVRKPGSSSFSAKLRFTVSSRARGATVAVGEKGDILVAYEDAHEIRARHIGPHGSVGAVHKLGDGVQSKLRAVVNDDGRLEVAWESQRVSEGESGSPALVWFATAAPGHGFGPARKVATVGQTGAQGRPVSAPGLRLLAIGDDALLAYTGFDGTNYTVEASQVSGGHIGAAQRLSPAGSDAVLGDAAVDAQGAQVVAWRSGVTGDGPSRLPGGQLSHTPVLANVRAAAGAAFGPAELVSPADADVAFAPSAALDPVSGRAIVAYGVLAPQSAVIASRTAVGM